MLATFVIGLREGLEAVLIVGIVAAFLKRNNISRRPMWLGVIFAVLISIGVGIALKVLEQSLPQAQQEGLETVIGLIAVVFVTGMIFWMGKNARGMKAELEHSAQTALSRNTGMALTLMAFLAVLKEGFETAIFLLATVTASTNGWLAALGAALGLAGAVVVGCLIYVGGTKINLGRFFKISSVFLVFVAAGLLLTAARSAHEAGWLNVGQQRTADLSWLAPVGSVRSALITGVLGIPADPRLVEVIAYLAFLIPVLAIILWPKAWKLPETTIPTLKFSIAGVLAVCAVVLIVAVPTKAENAPSSISINGGTARLGSANSANSAKTLEVQRGGQTQTLTFPASTRQSVDHAGLAAEQWTTQSKADTSSRPRTLTMTQLVALVGKIPVGISPSQNPGPFNSQWAVTEENTLWTARDGILDARQTQNIVLTLSGGGLTDARTITLSKDAWAAPEASVNAVADQLTSSDMDAHEATLWRFWIPSAALICALFLAITAWRQRSLTKKASNQSTKATLAPKENYEPAI